MSNSIYFNTLKKYENEIALNEFGRGKDKKKRRAKASMGRRAAEGAGVAAGIGTVGVAGKYGVDVAKRSGAKALPTSALATGKKGMNIPGGNSAAAQRVKAAANIVGNDAKNTVKKGAYQAGMLAGKGTGAAKNTGSKVAGFLGKAARKLLRK